MPKFRKRPVVIEAVRITKPMMVQTLEGPQTGSPGDWLITGIKGEQYFCNHDVFLKTYEPADEEAAEYLRKEIEKEDTIEAIYSEELVRIPEEFDTEKQALRNRVKKLEDAVMDAVRIIGAIVMEQGGIVRIRESTLRTINDKVLERTDDQATHEIIFQVRENKETKLFEATPDEELNDQWKAHEEITRQIRKERTQMRAGPVSLEELKELRKKREEISKKLKACGITREQLEEEALQIVREIREGRMVEE